jgi:hypothetical protein
VRGIAVEFTRRGTDQLQLRYRMDGDIRSLRVPAAAQALRATELWQHTCCELFLSAGTMDAYYEYNFSPSGRWAAYQFSRYRVDMQELALREAPHIDCVQDAASLILTAQLQLEARHAPVGVRVWVGLTTVIETVDGALSYWALKHAPGRADFHHAAGYLEMEL